MILHHSTLGVLVGLLSLVAFFLGFFLWLSLDEIVLTGWSGIALVLMFPVSVTLYYVAWRLVSPSAR